MRKEILFAIIAGCLFGLVIAFGIWKANTSIEKTTEIESQTGDEAQAPISTSEFTITIAKPENNQVITSNPVNISGLTKSNAWVAISTEEKDYLTKSAQNGSFEEDVDLTGGVNEIIINAYDDIGNSSQVKIILVYSTEFDKETAQVESSNEN